ncbi:MAG: DUF6491 family protein [Gammaproteobacteria bacterium]|nr:DUF6491 family protein [Gammaproteobacteria bacterium]MDH3429049.1 DUF6491 family protein [Gammaproteobacteria bacterium]MDH3435055.1 DUF6491 family protein [Gammaproteobacteria bacterium]
MLKPFFNLILILFTSSIILACVGTPEASDESASAGQTTRRDCISQSSIRDYQVLDDSNLIVTAAVKRKYHVVLSRRAFGLRSSWKIGFHSATGMFCGNTGEVIFDDGFGTESIRIASVRALEPEELDELLIRFGKKDPEIEQAPAIQDVEGAEVEELD